MILCELPAGRFASAWRSAFVASSADGERPALHKTVLVETFGERAGVRFSATDSYVLVSAAATTHEGDLPPLDLVPETTYLVADPDGRVSALAAYAAKLAVRADKNDQPHPVVVVSIEADEESDQPALTAEMERFVAVIEILDHEQVIAPIIETPFPDYRSVLVGAKGEPPAEFGLTPYVAEKVAKILKVSACGVFEIEPRGLSFRLTADGPAHIDGMFMAARLGAE